MTKAHTPRPTTTSPMREIISASLNPLIFIEVARLSNKKIPRIAPRKKEPLRINLKVFIYPFYRLF